MAWVHGLSDSPSWTHLGQPGSVEGVRGKHMQDLGGKKVRWLSANAPPCIQKYFMKNMYTNQLPNQWCASKQSAAFPNPKNQMKANPLGALRLTI